MVTQKIKASDRQNVCRKLVASLKKKYKKQPPKYELGVLETILFGVCLENADYEQADVAYERLTSGFYDLNEIRVSSITEIQNAFQDMSHPEWRAQRIRETLQYVFESYYSFDLEVLQKKTLEQAEKILNKIKSLSPFVKNYTLMSVLGAHVVPVDSATKKFVLWVGLATPDNNESEVSDVLKSAIRKAETAQFCYLLRLISTSPEYVDFFDDVDAESPGENGEPLLFSAPGRLNDLLAGKLKKKKPTSSKTKTSEKKTAKKSKKAASKSTSKKTAKKTPKSTKKASRKPAKNTKKTARKKSTGKRSKK